MNKMFRLCLCLVACLMVTSLAACSGGEDDASASQVSSVADEDKYSNEQPGLVGKGDEELTYQPWSLSDDENRTQDELDEIYRARARSCVPRVIFVDETRYELAINKLAVELGKLCFAEMSFEWDDERLYDRALTDDDMKFVASVTLDNWPEGEYNPETGEPTKAFQEEYKEVTGSDWLEDMRKLYVGD